MAWYSAGSVQVTNGSNAVTGTGTDFIANARVDDGFVGPDGRLYMVTNAASATSLSISPNYAGTTAGAQPYKIIPVQGYNAESARLMRQIISEWSDQLSNQQPWTYAPTESAARDALGLGTISTQNANAIAVTGGTINATAIGSSARSTGAFTSLETTGGAGFGVANDGSARIQSLNGIKLGNIFNSDPLVLDFYQRNGTFTVSATGASTAGAPSAYTKRSGVYNRIGNIYICRIELGWTGHTGSGLLRIAGLPVTPVRSSAASFLNDGIPFSSGNIISPAIIAGSPVIDFYQTSPSGSLSAINIPSSVTTLSINFILEA